MEMNFLKKVLGDDTSTDGGFYFNDATQVEDAEVVIVSVPWSVTSDYGRGATYTPDAIIDVSAKSGVYDALSGVNLKGRIATAVIDYNIQEISEQLGRDAERVDDYLGGGTTPLPKEYIMRKKGAIDEGFSEMQKSTYQQVKQYAEMGKVVAVVGGDHSVAYGAVKAVAECYEGVGVLFIDAHADFEISTAGYNYTHRTIARNIIEEIDSVERVVEVGVRDVSQEEMTLVQSSPKVDIFLAESLAAARFEGRSWKELCQEVVSKLPQRVYISFDIDALKIEFCQNTNAPVPGGMTFDEVIYLIGCVAASGREIVGFDISEVVPDLEDRMDATVAARLLGKMCVVAIK